jgi:hypothetical protein
MQIKGFKLITGEEVITRCEQQEDCWIFDKPMILMMIQTNNGVGMQLVPYIMGNQDGQITVKESAIVGVLTSLSSQLEKEYIKSTTSIQLT